MVNGKTGMRRVRIVASAPALTQWLANHSSKEDLKQSLWVGLWTKNYGKPLDYDAVRINLGKIAKRAKIKKRICPHLFRHSRASHLAT